MAPGDLDSADLQCFLVYPEMDLAPDAPFGTAMLAGVPFAFALDLDPGDIDQQVQRALVAAVGDGQSPLTARQRTEVRHQTVKANQAQQALDQPGRLPGRHAERALGSTRSGLKQATGLFPGRPSPFIERHVCLAASL